MKKDPEIHDMHTNNHSQQNNQTRSRHQKPQRQILTPLVLATGLLLSGCTSNDSDTTVEATNPPTTAPVPATATEADPEPSPTEYIPASSAGPAQNVPLPQVPWEISYNNEKGAKAFVQYWFDVLRYVELTGNPEPLKEISDPNCAYCNRAMQLIPELYEEGRWIDRGRYIINDMTTETNEETGITTIFGTIIHEPTLFYETDGSVIPHELNESNVENDMVAEIYYSEEKNHMILLSFFAESQ